MSCLFVDVVADIVLSVSLSLFSYCYQVGTSSVGSGWCPGLVIGGAFLLFDAQWVGAFWTLFLSNGLG